MRPDQHPRHIHNSMNAWLNAWRRACAQRHRMITFGVLPCPSFCRQQVAGRSRRLTLYVFQASDSCQVKGLISANSPDSDLERHEHTQQRQPGRCCASRASTKQCTCIIAPSGACRTRKFNSKRGDIGVVGATYAAESSAYSPPMCRLLRVGKKKTFSKLQEEKQKIHAPNQACRRDGCTSSGDTELELPSGQ